MKVFKMSNYRCGDILSDAELHVDSEYGTLQWRWLIVKKLFSKNCFYTMMLLTENRRFFTGRSTRRRSTYELQICLREALCNFRPIFLFNLLQWPIMIRHISCVGPGSIFLVKGKTYACSGRCSLPVVKCQVFQINCIQVYRVQFINFKSLP